MTGLSSQQDAGPRRAKRAQFRTCAGCGPSGRIGSSQPGGMRFIVGARHNGALQPFLEGASPAPRPANSPRAWRAGGK